MPNITVCAVVCTVVVLAGEALSLPLGGQQTNSFTAEWPRENRNKAIVSLSDFHSGGPGKDGIPSLNQPHFLSVREANSQLNLREPVIVYSTGDVARGYPLSVLLWHEIINDTVNGQPIAVTYCPLCNASIVFDRQIAKQTLDFGVTGLLRHSDMVMYDHQTQSWWQQFTGECLAGKFCRTRLRILQSNVMSYAEFRSTYPGGKVLSSETGHDRAYGTNPYRSYDDPSSTPSLYTGTRDPRLPPLERVLGVVVGEQSRAYAYSVLEKDPVITDRISGSTIVIVSIDRTLSVLDRHSIALSKSVLAPRAFSAHVEKRNLAFVHKAGRMMDKQTHSTWNTSGKCIDGPLKGRVLLPIQALPTFSFAWFAFHPKSTVYALPAQEF